MYKRILLTHDGSDVADAAVPHAVAIATATGAAITVLRVIDSVAHIVAQATPAGFEPTAGATTVEIAEEAVAAERAAAQQQLGTVAERLRGEGVAEVSVEIIEGIAGDSIVEAAERLGADLVVMATHGRGGLGRVLLGSVADHVVRHIGHAAVLLVRPPHQD
jgi:nucleotide-binding universal stress UspA family protein